MKIDTQTVYARRYADGLAFHDRMWSVLCRDFFQRFVSPDGAVAELGAGHCGFINNIQARRKVAIDVNPDLSRHASDGVAAVVSSVTDLSALADGSLDLVFASNLFEHLDRPEILLTFREVRRVLSRKGKFLILQPNIRFCCRDYWMFFDHVTALDERSMTEALGLEGFDVTSCIPRFLPFTTHGRLPKSVALLRLYLRLPPIWRIFGGQFFLCAERREGPVL